MEKESFRKSIYTLETLATEMFWRDKNGVPVEQVYWNRGLWAEQERLRKALDEGMVINNEWCRGDFRVPRVLTHAHGLDAYLNGMDEFRRRIEAVLNHGVNFTVDCACKSFLYRDLENQQFFAPDYARQYFRERGETMTKKKVLPLVIGKKWFKKIVSGDKTVECLEITKYWTSRLVNQQAESGDVLFDEFGGYSTVVGKPEYKPFTHVLFYAGLAEDRQVVEKKIESISIGKTQKGMCRKGWLNKDVFIIKFK